MSTTLKYFSEEGIENPERRIFVQGYPTRTKRTGGSVIIKKGEFTPAEVAKLEAVVVPPFVVAHSPLRQISGSPYSDLLHADNPEQFYSDFPFDVTPITDDRPYFYLFDKEMTEHKSDFFKFIIMLALLTLIPSVVLLLRNTTVRATPFYWGLPYFSIIAVAFMAVEGALVSKVALFVGNPVLSLTVVLVVLLVGGGVGSALSGRLSGNAVNGIIYVVPVLVVLVALGLPVIFRHVVVASLTGRAAIVALCLLPLAVTMGMPFPSMLQRIREDVAPGSASLLYAINGAFSALTIMLVMFLAPRTGLSAWLYVGASLYFVAAIIFWRSSRRSPSTFSQ